MGAPAVGLTTSHTGRWCNWCRDLGERRLVEGCRCDEVAADLRVVGSTVIEILSADLESESLGTALHDLIDNPFAFGIDRVLEIYEDAEVFGTDSAAR